MQVYKALRPFSVLSFDLDDTLYDNKPVIAAAEQAMLEALADLTPASQTTDSHFWWQQRVKLARIEPEIRHDIGRWRLLGIEAGLIELGISRPEARVMAEQGYAAFLHERTRITLTDDVMRLLQALASRYRLIAITNGNACINKMGIGDLFEFSLQAGPDGKMKPYSDLFHIAATRLQVSAAEILHIGDSHRADVLGALNAGCQAAWLDHYQSKIAVLPHLRLTDITQLSSLL